jgi:hypothetical protein
MRTDDFVQCVDDECCNMDFDIEIHEFLYADVPSKIYMDIEKNIRPDEKQLYEGCLE